MIKKAFLSLTVIVLLFSCGGGDDGPSTGGSDDDNGGGVVVEDNFDREAMLIHLADDIIIPAFEDFGRDVAALRNAADIFTTTPTEDNLTELQAEWLNAYKTWQYVEMFTVGRAEELASVNFMNIYPVTVSDIEANVASNGNYDLSSTNNHDAQSFPALDYLLFGAAVSSADTVALFSTNENAQGYVAYLTDVIARIEEVNTDILNSWNTSFRAEFIEASGNTSASSLNKLTNDFIFYFEKGLRANKFGIPGGSFSGDAAPNTVEALFNEEVSQELALDALQAVEDFFNGKDYNGTNEELGFREYLEFLERDDLVTAITGQIEVSRGFINNLDPNFHQQTITDSSKMTETFDQLQMLVVYFKVDMLQAFDITVDFIDGDGD